MDKKKNPADPDPLGAAIEQAGTKAFNPSSDQAARTEGQKEFGDLISRIKTFALIQALNPLIKPDRVPRWLRVPLMDTLTLLPQRPDGVRATLEFVFSVHPSSTIKNSEASTAQKQGANITMEALKMASNLIAVPPTGVTPDAWFPGIGPQLLALLEGKNGDDLAKVAAYVIGFGILGRRQYGAPGSTGWKTFAEPMLAAIDPAQASTTENSKEKIKSENDIVDLRKQTVLVDAPCLATALHRLSSLLNSHPNPGLTKRLLGPLLLPLWTLASWHAPTENTTLQFCQPARSLLEVYLRLSGSTDKFIRLIGALLSKGHGEGQAQSWQYEESGESGIRIIRLEDGFTSKPNALSINWDELEFKVDVFVKLLEAVGTDADISTLYLSLLQESFAHTPEVPKVEVIIKKENDATIRDPITQLVDSKILQKMMEAVPDKLISDAKSMLTFASEVLAKGGLKTEVYSEGLPNDDGEALALSLVNLVVTTPNFQVSKVDPVVLSSIEKSLARIAATQKPEVSQTAHNLSLLLKYRDHLEDPNEQHAPQTDRQIEDRKTYQLAMQYITQADSPPPVRSEGINLLSKLIQSSSPVLDIPSVLTLLSSLLSEDEDYTTLRVMKLFTLLATHHASTTTKEVLEHYIDSSESHNTDTRLRFGETLLQIIQRLGQAFTGPIAESTAQTLLSISSLRIRRPETAARVAREDALKARQHAEAVEAYGGDASLIPDLSDAIRGEPSEREKENNRVLAQIIAGWENPQRKGGEDIRMRASALSILGVVFETNIAGLRPEVVEASVDLCTDILTSASSEAAQGIDTGILRRAAVIAILSFVKALADAKESGRKLGFGLTDSSREGISRVLRWVAETDSDGLVRQHASDCLESLESWSLIELLPSQREQQSDGAGIAGLGGAGGIAGSGVSGRGLASLSGLTDRPNLPSLDQGSRPRPRIEEIE